MAGFLSRLRSFLDGRRTPPPPRTAKVSLEGYRGIAAEHVADEPHSERIRELQEADEPLSESEMNRFMNGEEAIQVNSSNVAWAKYLPDTNQLDIGFRGGSIYRYSNISRPEAASFLTAHSKGAWVWSNLRVRGTRNGHRKPYMKIG